MKKKTKKKKSKKPKRVRKRSPGKIDPLELTTWLIFTILFAIGIMFLGGYISENFNDIEYLWGKPIQMSGGAAMFGIAMWGIISLLLNLHYKNN